MAQNDKTRNRQDEAVSEIIGEILMLAITVMIFAILIAVVNAVISKPPTEIVQLDARALNDTTLTIRHMGGDTIAYGKLAVVIDGHVKTAAVTDTNSNGQWDLGESLYVYGVNTSNSLSVMVYNSMTSHVLGDFTVEKLPESLPIGLPSPSPSASPSPSPSASPSPSVSPSPSPQVTISGNAWVSNVQSSGNGWVTYTMDVVLQVDNNGPTAANNVVASCSIPAEDQAHGIKNVNLISSPSPGSRSVAGYSNTQYTWRYTMDLQQNHKTIVYNLSATGSNTNTLTRQVTFGG